MFFYIPGNATEDVRGQKTINVKTTGGEKQHFTAVLACMADGTKLKPMMVFKRTKLCQKKNFQMEL